MMLQPSNQIKTNMIWADLPVLFHKTIYLLKHKHILHMNIINEVRGVFTVSSCVQAQVLHAVPDQFCKLLPFRAA